MGNRAVITASKAKNVAESNDNGVYIIKGWEIVGREYFEGEEQRYHDLLEMLEEIDDKQPEGERLRHEVLECAVNGGE